MVQLMPDDYPAVRVLLDNETGRETTLGALTPEWWIQPGSDKK